MGNTSLTTDLITREALRVAHEKLSFLGTINREYDSSFAGAGGKHGSTLRVRKPVQYTRRTGSRVMDIQDSLETSSTITVATQDGVDMRFNSAELTLDIEDFSQRYIVPAVSQLVAGIEGDMISQFTKDIYNVVGTAGTPPADLAALGAARARLNQQLAPKDGQRFVQMDSVTMGGMVNGLKGLFQDSAQIKEAMREGFYGRLAMADLYENEKVWTMPNSGDVAGTLDTYTVVEGDTDLTVTGFSAAPVAGMVFTIAGVYDCHPETKAAYSHLKQFVVTSATTTVINFSPAIRISGARKNVSTATGADISPSTTAAITFVGNASTNYQQSLMYHKDAFTFVTADLPIMDDAAKCVRRTQDGLSLRVWQGSDIRNDEMLTRIDILYGGLTLRPEWAVRITS
jgi:hypothetical protein